MREYTFTMNLTYQDWLAFYKGYYREIMVSTEQGQKLKIPADRFTSFTTPYGLYGRYRLVLTRDNKIASLAQL